MAQIPMCHETEVDAGKWASCGKTSCAAVAVAVATAGVAVEKEDEREREKGKDKKIDGQTKRQTDEKKERKREKRRSERKRKQEIEKEKNEEKKKEKGNHEVKGLLLFALALCFFPRWWKQEKFQRRYHHHCWDHRAERLPTPILPVYHDEPSPSQPAARGQNTTTTIDGASCRLPPIKSPGCCTFRDGVGARDAR